MNVTSGGIESGAPPICEGRGVEVENGREETGKAGRRNDGRVIEGDEAIALSRPFERAVESIVLR